MGFVVRDIWVGRAGEGAGGGVLSGLPIFFLKSVRSRHDEMVVRRAVERNFVLVERFWTCERSGTCILRTGRILVGSSTWICPFCVNNPSLDSP